MFMFGKLAGMFYVEITIGSDKDFIEKCSDMRFFVGLTQKYLTRTKIQKAYSAIIIFIQVASGLQRKL